MEFTEHVIKNLVVLNDALNNLGVDDVFTNPDFIIDKSLLSNFYLKIWLKKPQRPRITFIISNYDLQIDIDRITEAVMWSSQQIKENQHQITKYLEILLSHNIMIEYFGKNYTKISFYDKNDNYVSIIKQINGFYLKIWKEMKSYSAIYEKII